MSDTATWLRELGAVRPMAPVGHEALVLGRLHDGYYPIHWTRHIDTWTGTFNDKPIHPKPVEQWWLFGFRIHEPVAKEDCERILLAMSPQKS